MTRRQFSIIGLVLFVIAAFISRNTVGFLKNNVFAAVALIIVGILPGHDKPIKVKRLDGIPKDTPYDKERRDYYKAMDFLEEEAREEQYVAEADAEIRARENERY